MAHPGVLHRYTSKLVAFEHASRHSSTGVKNHLLWIGGLGDGLLTVEYPSAIASQLPPNWSLVEVLLSSSYEGWRTGNLARDANELADCVTYFRGLEMKRKIVLMGHSTGCQDIMEYLTGNGSAERLKSGGSIAGAILQGAVSDREASVDDVGQQSVDAVVEQAKKMIDAGKEGDFVARDNHPLVGSGEAPVTAYRTYNLLAPGGDDDYFSSGLEDSVLQNTFGRLAQATSAVMFLLGGSDQHVPDAINKEALISRWTDIIRQNGGQVDDKDGGVVPGARHNLNGDPEPVVQDLVTRVVKFLSNIDRGAFERVKKEASVEDARGLGEGKNAKKAHRGRRGCAKKKKSHSGAGETQDAGTQTVNTTKVQEFGDEPGSIGASSGWRCVIF